MTRRVRELNARVFGGRLREVPVLMSDARTYCGRCEYQRRRTLLGHEERSAFRMRFSRLFDLTPQEWDDIIVHEMIHLDIALSGRHDASAHGPLFRKMMKEINDGFGMHITISTKHRPVVDPAEATTKHYHVVARITDSDGRTGFKVLPRVKQSIVKYYNGLVASGARHVSLHLHYGTAFNEYPVSAALRFHPASDDELDRLLQGTRQLLCDGKTTKLV